MTLIRDAGLLVKPATIVRRVAYILLILALLIWLVIAVYPVFFLFLTAFKNDTEILNYPFEVPRIWRWEYFEGVWAGKRANGPFSMFLTNSLIVTAGTLLLLLFVSGLAGYSLARGRFPGSAGIQQAFLVTLAVPAHALVIPIFFMMDRLGLRNNLMGLILIYTTLGMPFTAMMMRAYFQSFPVELEEAALIDGCSRLGVFWRVVIPISRNAMASMAIINVTWVWSELFFAMVLMDRALSRTLPVGVVSYAPVAMMGDANAIGPQFAAMTIAAVPLIIFFFLFQRQITKGMTMGAFR